MSRVRIEVRAPRMRGPAGHEIKWTIKVPRGVAVDLRTVNGGVKMARPGGRHSRPHHQWRHHRHRHHRDRARCLGHQRRRRDRARHRRSSTGSFQLEAVNGGVSLTLPPRQQGGSRGALRQRRHQRRGPRSAGRRRRAPNPNEFEQHIERAKSFRRRLEGQLNGGGARVSLETVNGGVKLLRTAEEPEPVGDQGSGIRTARPGQDRGMLRSA